MERILPTKWRSLLNDEITDDRREFIRAIDAVKKRNQRARNNLSICSDVPDRGENGTSDLRDAVNTAAFEVLSHRQKKILDLTFDGWSVSEIATDLETSDARISDEKYKAIRKLKNYFGTI